jgi:hypothetical protein
MTGFDAVVRVARLALQSSAEGVETLHRYVARAASAYRIDVDVMVLPEQILLKEQEASPPRWPGWLRVLGVALFAAGFAPSIVASWSEVAAAAALGLVMGVLLVATQGTRIEGLLPFFGAFVVTILAATALTGLAERTSVTLIVLPALGAFANVVGAHPCRPPRLILLLGSFFVLTVGGVGVRGATALFAGDVISGLQDLADFALQVPTVALAIAIGVIATDHWLRSTKQITA